MKDLSAGIIRGRRKGRGKNSMTMRLVTLVMILESGGGGGRHTIQTVQSANKKISSLNRNAVN